MKKTLVALMAMAGFASAADLVAEWNGFTSLVSGDYSFVISGSTTVDANGILNVVGASNGSAYVNIAAAGLTFDEGFTLNMLVNNVGGYGSNAPFAFVGLRGDTTEFLATAGITSDSKGKFCLNGGASKITTNIPTDNNSIEAVKDTSTFSAITLTFTDVNFKMYLNGELVATGTPNSGQMTTNMAAETITKIALGSWAGASGSSTLKEHVASFAIYDGAMTADEVKAMVVPEPATATLSLLALAGLAARRRRK